MMGISGIGGASGLGLSAFNKYITMGMTVNPLLQTASVSRQMNYGAFQSMSQAQAANPLGIGNTADGRENLTAGALSKGKGTNGLLSNGASAANGTAATGKSAIGISNEKSWMPGQSEPAQSPMFRLGADPAEMEVRGRIQYLGQGQQEPLGKTPVGIGENEADKAALGGKVTESEKAKTPQEAMEEGECQTCNERKYQDGSDDPGVSFKNPTNIDPKRVAAAVRSHEMEHVSREQSKAEREDRKVISQSVTIHTSICPDCGKVYVSGGTTRTTTAKDNSQEMAEEQQNKVFGGGGAA